MTEKYHVYIPNSISKIIRKIPIPWQVRILNVLTDLETKPNIGERMEGDKKDRRKIRVWPYRIMYEIDQSINFIKIVELEHRGHTSYD